MMKMGMDKTVQLVKNNALDVFIAASIWTLPLKNLGFTSFKAITMGEYSIELFIFMNFVNTLYFKEKLYKKLDKDSNTNKILLANFHYVAKTLYPAFKSLMAGLNLYNAISMANDVMQVENDIYRFAYQAASLPIICFIAINEGIYESSVILNNIYENLETDGLIKKDDEDFLEKNIPEASYGVFKFHYFIELLYSAFIPLCNEEKIPEYISLLNITSKSFYNSLSIITAAVFNSWVQYYFNFTNEYLELNISEKEIAKSALFVNFVIFSYYFIQLQKKELMQCTQYIKDNFKKEKVGNEHISKKGNLRLTPVLIWLANQTTTTIDLLGQFLQKIDNSLQVIYFDEEQKENLKSNTL